MNSSEKVKPRTKVRVPIQAATVPLNRTQFKAKALKAYFENKRRRNQERLNQRRGINSISDGSSQDCELSGVVIEKLWEDYQSFYINAPENVEFDVDQAIAQYLTLKVGAQSLASTQYIEDYYVEQEEELNVLLQDFQSLSLCQDPSKPSLTCPICTIGSLGLEGEDYYCKICNISAKNQVDLTLFWLTF